MIDPQFMIVLKGKSYPLYAGLLAAATEAQLVSIRTTVVQIPAAENEYMAVVMARAEFADGRVFEDVGDCSPENCSKQIATAALRMASTRAKGRVLRDALNVGMTMFEELPDLNAGESRSEPVESTGDRQAGNSAGNACLGCGQGLTAGQAQFSARKFGRALCHDCQRQQAGRLM